MSRRIVEEHHPYLLNDLLQPHTLGRSFYMRPSERPKIEDKQYSSNEAFWHDVLDERISAERIVSLKNFNVFEWVPRNPGLFHTRDAESARNEARYHVRSLGLGDEGGDGRYDPTASDTDAAVFRAATMTETSARKLIYTPMGKISMLRGGIGCVRFKPLDLKTGGTAWLMSATSTYAPDEGIPLLLYNNDYLDICDALSTSGAVCCDVIGRTKFVAREFSDLFGIQNGIPRLYVEVLKVQSPKKVEKPGEVSVAASFLSAFEGESKIYASYVTFNPGHRHARVNAAQWLKEEYVERLYQGSLLTDFDQRAPIFSDALFTLDQVLTSPDLADKIAKLKRLYGHFDWSTLKGFSYIEHRGDLIVTNNTITVTNSTNVVIQSTLTNAQLTAGAMPKGDDKDKKELQALLQQLQEALPKAPFDKSEQAEAVAAQAKGMVEEAAKSQPNKTMLSMIGQGLKNTADFLKDTVPSAVTIAGQIVSLIGKIHGL